MAIVAAIIIVMFRLVGEIIIYSARNVNCFITE